MNREFFLNIEKAIDMIRKSKNIFIASHINPDGDNIGSSLALTLALKKNNKNVFVLKSDMVPANFVFLPGIDLIEEYNEKMEDIDLFIALDCGNEYRLGENKTLFENAQKTINIDHHISNTNFGDINIVDPRASATGEIIYNFIKYLDIDLDKEIATNLYTAISTDTGSFKYESVTSETHKIISNLLDTGIDKSSININLYEKMSFTRMKLFIKSLTTLETFNNGQIVVVKITQDMLEETGASFEDAEGIISFIRKLETVEAACILKELEKENIKISIRTKKYLDASLICSKFDGGGHKRAADCTIYKEIKESKDLIVNTIKESMKV